VKEAASCKRQVIPQSRQRLGGMRCAKIRASRVGPWLLCTDLQLIFDERGSTAAVHDLMRDTEYSFFSSRPK
jgi:hypothetical protein